MNFLKAVSLGKPTQYINVEDARDLRIPVQNEEAFEHGITFKCKYVGTEEIPRPNSRVEIVAAMRRIRYEHKYRNMKKRKVYLEISADGIKVILRKKKRKKDYTISDSQLFVMQYPINRVFYVSHDSQDLMILSFIARGEDGLFRCSVFKGLTKSQAMHMVRTIGQAFEVCHRINVEREKSSLQQAAKTETQTAGSVPEAPDEKVGETDIDEYQDPRGKEPTAAHRASALVTDLDAVRDMKELPPPLLPAQKIFPFANGDLSAETHGPFTLQQLQQFYHQQLLLQMNEAEYSRTELVRIRDLLKSEQDGRARAQQQIHHLLAQNRELLVVVQRLMQQMQEKHSSEHSEPLNQTWMLSSLSSTGVVLGPGFSRSSMGLQSEVFDNSHLAASPMHDGARPDDLFGDLVMESRQRIESASQEGSRSNVERLGFSAGAVTNGSMSPVIAQHWHHQSPTISIQKSPETWRPVLPPRSDIDFLIEASKNPFSAGWDRTAYHVQADASLPSGRLSTAPLTATMAGSSSYLVGSSVETTIN